MVGGGMLVAGTMKAISGLPGRIKSLHPSQYVRQRGIECSRWAVWACTQTSHLLAFRRVALVVVVLAVFVIVAHINFISVRQGITHTAM